MSRCKATKELVRDRLNAVPFHTADSFKVRGLVGNVTAYPTAEAAREVAAVAAP